MTESGPGLFGVAAAEAPYEPADLEFILRRVVWIRGALETTNPVLVEKALGLLEDLETRLITDSLLHASG